MRIATLTVLAGAAALVAMTCLSAPAPKAAAEARPRTEKDPNEIVCKTTAVTGSRLHGDRVCMTRQAWADRTRASRDRLESTQHEATPSRTE